MTAAQKDRLRKCGELHYLDAKLGDDGILEQARGAEILLITPRLHFDVTTVLDNCRFISWQAAGLDALNLDACREKGIVVSNIPDFSTDAVAEHAWALILALAKRLEEGRVTMLDGRWTEALAYFTTGLRGRTLGLFGFGKIGQRIAEIAGAFGMQVIATVRNPSKQRSVETVEFEELLSRSDFLVVAAPATAETHEIFNRTAFEKMRRSAFLVNVARGALVNEEDLVAALDEGTIAGAGVDVFQQEPPDRDDPLVLHPKAVVTPHVAWGTDSAVELYLNESVRHVEDFVRGEPTDVVT
jgi:glycerate dehydrogenase